MTAPYGEEVLPNPLLTPIHAIQADLHIAVGRKLFTTKPWLDDFFNAMALAGAAHYDKQTAPPHPEPIRRKSHTDAVASLAAAGIK